MKADFMMGVSGWMKGAFQALLTFIFLSVAANSASALQGADPAPTADKIPVPQIGLSGEATPEKKSWFKKPVILAQSAKRRAAENAVRIDQLEEQMRSLTGQLEDIMFQLRQIQEQMRLIQEDNELRFQQLEQSDASQPSEQKKQQLAGTSPQGTPPVENEETTSAVSSFQLSASAQNNATALNNDAFLDAGDAIQQNEEQGSGDGPLDLAALANNPSLKEALGGAEIGIESGDPLLKGGQPVLGGQAALGTQQSQPVLSPNELYNIGYSEIIAGNYPAARTAFENFMNTYPNDPQAPNAKYWIAESYFAAGDFRGAANQYSETYRLFPQSRKAPDSLLKLSMALTELGEYETACATISEMFTRFETLPNSIITAGRQQMSIARC